MHDFISDSRLSEGADSKHETIKHAFNNTEIERERRKREQDGRKQRKERGVKKGSTYRGSIRPQMDLCCNPVKLKAIKASLCLSPCVFIADLLQASGSFRVTP